MDEEKRVPAEEELPAGAPDEQNADQAPSEAPEAGEDEWRAALTACVKQRDEYLLMAQRAQADFANFKRRNAQTRTDAYDDGVRETIAALLPVVDNLERAIAAAESQQDLKSLTEGVEMTRKLLMETLGKMGLEEVPALGEKFDPELHNAVMRAEQGEPGTVLEVFQKGYRVKGRMIRYAMVKVAAE